MFTRCVFKRAFSKNRKFNFRNSSSESNEPVNQEYKPMESKLGGFAKAYEKHINIKDVINVPVSEPSFSTLLRNSKFIDLGDPQGRIVSGTIFHVVENDLYIDFGWKFHCVCQRPNKNPRDYVRGAKVRLRIKDLELSSKFLGCEKDLTILEADAILLGLIYSPGR